ncbi:MAG: initiation control protein YabA [Bacillota bacterium]|jgi:regulator of replication initiation timing
MSLSRDLQEWEEKLIDLLSETQALRQRAEDLEKQNFLLQEQLSKTGDNQDGLEELARLYDEGFHICHAFFGQSLSEDCMFCLSFLHRRGIPEKE